MNWEETEKGTIMWTQCCAHIVFHKYVSFEIDFQPFRAYFHSVSGHSVVRNALQISEMESCFYFHGVHGDKWN